MYLKCYTQNPALPPNNLMENTIMMSMCTIKPVILTRKPLLAALKSVTIFTQIYQFCINQ